jgi:hypothetical protein
MADFLEGYAERNVRRDKAVRWVLTGIAAFAALWVIDLGLAMYGTYNFRDIRQQYTSWKFFRHLKHGRYQDAYRMWGCDPANPCRDYSMEKFLEDWGPKSRFRDLSKVETAAVRHCKTGIIHSLSLGPEDQVDLWVESRDLTISFAPWPVCDPRWQAPPGQ